MRKIQEYKQTEIGKIPKEWEINRVDEIFNSYGGTTPSTSKDEYWNGDILWVTPSDVTNLKGRLYLNRTKKKITTKAIRECSLRVFKKGTLLLTSRATIGFSVINARPVTINQGMTALLPKDNEIIHTLFYSYYIQRIKPYLEQLGSGSTFREVSRSTIKKLILPLPPTPEQKKIAEVLSTVDQGIEKADEAIEKTQRLKKGLMQELLTQGIGHKEFKDTEIGKKPEKWLVSRIDKIFDSYGGTTPSTSKDEYWNGDILWVTPTDVTNLKGRLYLNRTEKKITTKAIRECSLRVFKKGTLLLTSRATIGSTAINIRPVTTNQGMTALLPKDNETIHTLFYSYYFQRKKTYLEQLGSGSTFREVSRSTIKKIKVPLPPLPEQKKIASILSTVDERLELLRKRKKKLQRIKQGLMNDLLIGRKRVRV